MAALALKDCQRKPQFKFIWTIENASALQAYPYLKSPSFIVRFKRNTKCKLQLSLNTNFSKETMDMYIQNKEDNGPENAETEFEFSILASDGSVLGVQTAKKRITGMGYCWISKFLKREEVFVERRAEFLPNDSLTVCCQLWRTGHEISKYNACFARTHLEVDRRSFIWAIRELNSLQMGQKQTYCLYPTLNGSPQLVLSIFLSKIGDKSYVSIQIDQYSATKDRYMFCKFSILDSDGRIVHCRENIADFSMSCPNVYTFHDFFIQDLLVSDSSTCLPNNVLSLKCEFLINADPVCSQILNYMRLNFKDLTPIVAETSDMHHCPFKKAFEDWYDDKSLCDVSLRVGKIGFPAHRIVLISRSLVFKNMFAHDMKEKASNIVDIADVSAATLGRLLLYIYKDTIQDLQIESAIDLFIAADKYQLLDLRKKCSLFLIPNLSLINVFSFLSLADMHEDLDLRKAAEDFISEHNDEIFNSEEWKNFKEENSLLALEIIEKIIKLGNRKKL